MTPFTIPAEGSRHLCGQHGVLDTPHWSKSPRTPRLYSCVSEILYEVTQLKDSRGLTELMYNPTWIQEKQDNLRAGRAAINIWPVCSKDQILRAAMQPKQRKKNMETEAIYLRTMHWFPPGKVFHPGQQ